MIKGRVWHDLFPAPWPHSGQEVNSGSCTDHSCRTLTDPPCMFTRTAPGLSRAGGVKPGLRCPPAERIAAWLCVSIWSRHTLFFLNQIWKVESCGRELTAPCPHILHARWSHISRPQHRPVTLTTPWFTANSHGPGPNSCLRSSLSPLRPTSCIRGGAPFAWLA